MENMKALQESVRAARERTGRHVGTTVKSGKIWVVEITKAGRKTVVTDLSKPGFLGDAIDFLDSL